MNHSDALGEDNKFRRSRDKVGADMDEGGEQRRVIGNDKERFRVESSGRCRRRRQ